MSATGSAKENSLSQDKRDSIFNFLKSSVADFIQFDRLVAEKLRQAIRETDVNHINEATTKKVVRQYYDKKLFTTKEQKTILAEIEIVFKACYVLLYSLALESDESVFWPNTTKLVDEYQEFEHLTETELTLLLRFRNMMAVALRIIPAEKNKQCLIKVAALLEGQKKVYITGGGQQQATAWRVAVYEREGGVTPKKRPERSVPDPDDEEAQAKRRKKDIILSTKKLTLIRLTSSDVNKLSQAPVDPLAGLEQRHYPDYTADTFSRMAQNIMSPTGQIVGAAEQLLSLSRQSSTDIKLSRQQSMELGDIINILEREMPPSEFDLNLQHSRLSNAIQHLSADVPSFSMPTLTNLPSFSGLTNVEVERMVSSDSVNWGDMVGLQRGTSWLSNLST